MSLDSNEFWIWTFLACGVVMIGFTLFARCCSSSPAVSRKKLERLRVGMTTEEVTRVLGDPRDKKAAEKQVQLWIYGARWKRHSLVAEFNGTGRLQNFVHGMGSERQPGKVGDD